MRETTVDKQLEEEVKYIWNNSSNSRWGYRPIIWLHEIIHMWTALVDESEEWSSPQIYVCMLSYYLFVITLLFGLIAVKGVLFLWLFKAEFRMFSKQKSHKQWLESSKTGLIHIFINSTLLHWYHKPSNTYVVNRKQSFIEETSYHSAHALLNKHVIVTD